MGRDFLNICNFKIVRKMIVKIINRNWENYVANDRNCEKDCSNDRFSEKDCSNDRDSENYCSNDLVSIFEDDRVMNNN